MSVNPHDDSLWEPSLRFGRRNDSFEDYYEQNAYKSSTQNNNNPRIAPSRQQPQEFSQHHQHFQSQNHNTQHNEHHAAAAAATGRTPQNFSNSRLSQQEFIRRQENPRYNHQFENPSNDSQVKSYSSTALTLAQPSSRFPAYGQPSHSRFNGNGNNNNNNHMHGDTESLAFPNGEIDNGDPLFNDPLYKNGSESFKRKMEKFRGLGQSKISATTLSKPTQWNSSSHNSSDFATIPANTLWKDDPNDHRKWRTFELQEPLNIPYNSQFDVLNMEQYKEPENYRRDADYMGNATQNSSRQQTTNAMVQRGLETRDAISENKRGIEATGLYSNGGGARRYR